MVFENDLFQTISKMHSSHSRNTSWFQEHEILFANLISNLHGSDKKNEFNFGEIGNISYPYFSMGDISSISAFGLDELIIFSYLYKNRNKYKMVLDLGANIGMHTLVMKKLGFQVVSYEPDLLHIEQFKKIMRLNNLSDNNLVPKAISDKQGTMRYVRVLGNTTGSHLLGSKKEPYGLTEIVEVEVDDILKVLNEFDFDYIKMDVEGHEAILLNRITAQSIATTDIMLEIGSKKNAKEIFTILIDKKIPAYAQKINWGRVEKLEDLPNHHTHGSLFLSMQGPPNWN